jgi:hypothetical protein
MRNQLTTSARQQACGGRRSLGVIPVRGEQVFVNNISACAHAAA